MLKLKLAILALCSVTILPAVTSLRAEDPPAAPLPTEILAARRVFIANGGGDPNTAGAIYNELYADMKAWGHYQLVRDPSEADLVLQIRFGRIFMGTPGIKLELRDPKTNTLLWTLDEVIRKPNEKGADESVDKLVDDLKALIASPIAK